MNIKNVPLKKFLKFLESEGCNHIRTKGGHYTYSKQGLNRPIVIQSHIDPVPTFIVAQTLRALNVERHTFIQKMKEIK